MAEDSDSEYFSYDGSDHGQDAEDSDSEYFLCDGSDHGQDDDVETPDVKEYVQSWQESPMTEVDEGAVADVSNSYMAEDDSGVFSLVGSDQDQDAENSDSEATHPGPPSNYSSVVISLDGSYSNLPDAENSNSEASLLSPPSGERPEAISSAESNCDLQDVDVELPGAKEYVQSWLMSPGNYFHEGAVSDLPNSMSGTFQFGPGNSVNIQSGPGSRPNPAIHIGNEAAPPPPRRFRMANVVSADHRRCLNNLYLNRELDRLASFSRWPASRPNVAPTALAKSGFFYLGDMDRTQCFSCGGVLRNWTLEDDVQEEHRTHFPTCHHVQGRDVRNVPVPERPETPEDRMRLYPCRYPASPHMRNEAARLDTFDHSWPATRIGATPAIIARAGFFFLGERDRVKCWYCSGGLQNWEYDDIPWDEHAKWFPNCQFLLQTKGQAFVYRHLAPNPHLARPIIARQEGSPIDPAVPGIEGVRAQDIPPSGPSVRQPSPPPTIIDPQEELRKKKERINGIVKNSEICKNVIAMGFSEQVVKSLLEERIDAGNEANSEDIYESASGLLEDVMKKEEEIQREAEVKEAARSQASMMSSVPSAYSTNFLSLTSSIGPPPGSGRYNVSFYDEDEPMDDQELYGSMNGPASVTSVASNATTAKQLKQEDETPKSLQEQLQKIEEERMCKICFSNTADMVFIPCSHMCCCMECTQAIRQCPVCRTKIEKVIKTYVK